MKMPKGKYWLGDPCYVVKPKYDWLEYLHELWKTDGVCTFKGKQVCAFSTATGDGTYKDQFGHEYPVDAGMIGLTPKSFFKGTPFGCHLVEFTEDVEVSSKDGVLTFGPFVIDTASADEDEE